MAALIVRPAALAEVLPLLERIEAPRSDTTMESATARDLCGACECFAVEEGGALVAAYSLALRQHDRAAVAWIVAAGGACPGHDLTAVVLPLIEAQAREAGAAQLAITTRRRGLLKKLTAQGFQVSGVTLRKKLQ